MADREGAMKAMQGLQTFWNERNVRERSMLATAFAVVALGLIWVLLLDPALSGREQLARALPDLRQQAAEVRALAREAGTADRRNPAKVAPVTREGVVASLARRGLKAEEVTVANDIVRVRFVDTSFAGLVEWLSEQQRASRLAVGEAKVERSGDDAVTSDRVNAAFTLRQQRGTEAQ